MTQAVASIHLEALLRDIAILVDSVVACGQSRRLPFAGSPHIPPQYCNDTALASLGTWNSAASKKHSAYYAWNSAEGEYAVYSAVPPLATLQLSSGYARTSA